mmetsp:Transcript_23390/g.53382  ORF Transcript_23390/g.53382 Transcript_23390/m.53382 type:complete len:266 (+) Transcript_23390:602-1399(+)
MKFSFFPQLSKQICTASCVFITRKAYQTLDSVTFNVLNQTKTLSAALFCFIILGRRQSQMQVMALLLLVLAALIIEGTISIKKIFGNSDSNEEEEEQGERQEIDPIKHFSLGVLPCLLASLISGLAGALSQRNLQKGGGRNSFLFSMEMAVFSIITLGISKFAAGDKKGEGDADGGWNHTMLIPILFQACGGLFVGLVTKYAGSVRKGFALLVGIVLTGIFQAGLVGRPITMEQIYGTFLVIVATYLHLTNPYVHSQTENQKKKQ